MDTLSQRSQDRATASNRTPSLSPQRQDARTPEGRRAQNGTPTAGRTTPTAGRTTPTAGRTVPPKPRGTAVPTARTSVPESRAGVLTATGAGPARRRAEGATTAVVLPKERAQGTPRSAPAQGPTTTQGAPRLQVANFKSEPKWDFEENYSLDVGGLQTVSFHQHPCSVPPCSEALLADRPPPPLPHRPGSSAPRLCLGHPCHHPTLLSPHPPFL